MSKDHIRGWINNRNTGELDGCAGSAGRSERHCLRNILQKGLEVKWGLRDPSQRWSLCYDDLVVGTVRSKTERKKTEGAAVCFLAAWSYLWWLIIHEVMSETEFLSGGRQTIVSRGSMVTFGFVIEITSVKVKREERNRERTKLFEIERMWTGSILWTAHGVTASPCASQGLVMVPIS